MPLRDDLLKPIAGADPSGADLYYDLVFHEIKEARREDMVVEQGELDSPPKKADFRQVAKLAGQSLATRSKDLRLAVWLVEATFRLEGLPVLAPCLNLFRSLQQDFWPTLHPEIEEGTDLALRCEEIAFSVVQLEAALREVPLTRSGLTRTKYYEAEGVGYERDAQSNDRMAARKEAIAAGKLTAEEFYKAIAQTPPDFYGDSLKHLAEAVDALQNLDEYQQEIYGRNPPSVSVLAAALQEMSKLFEVLHGVRLRTQKPAPGIVSVEEVEPRVPESAAPLAVSEESMSVSPQTAESWSETLPAAEVLVPVDAYAQVLAGARILFEEDPSSPVPYLVCAGLRLGETRRQASIADGGFAVGPDSEARRILKVLAAEGEWTGLLRAALPMLTKPCARAWLDLHRYIWKGAHESGANALADAVLGTMRDLLQVRPELRQWVLEDDTAAANPETQTWLDAEVRSGPADAAPAPQKEPDAVLPLVVTAEEEVPASAYDMAMQRIAMS